MSAQLKQRSQRGWLARFGPAWRGFIVLACASLLLLIAAQAAGQHSSQATAPTPTPTPTSAAHPVRDPGVSFFAVGGPVEPGYLHCSKCHEPLADQLESWMPHPEEDRQQCLLCHSTRSLDPFNESHNAIYNQTCQLCHMPAKVQ